MSDHLQEDTAPEKRKQPVRRQLQPMFHYKRLGRELAMQFLFECDLAGTDDLSEKLDNFWIQAECSGNFPYGKIFHKARAFAEKMIAGVCEHEEDINKIISEFSDKWDISRMAVVDRNIIRVAVYEMFYVPEVPVLVSIDEAIEISKDYSAEKSGIFINGLLNAIKTKVPPHSKHPAEPKTDSEQDQEGK